MHLVAKCIVFVTVLLNVNLILGFTIKNIKEDPVVEIKNGFIKGTVLTSKIEKIQYNAFRGIPYAKAPVDELRFLPAQPVDNWNDTLDTIEYKSGCVQIFGFFGGEEDCLYINVFSPNLDATDLPVMFWIYGGGFMEGNGANYKPDNFMEKDVVVVTFNYRVGIFGFYTTDDEVAPGNVGLKDQIFALQWVQENIKSFGGDPQKVTIFGQSAGSSSVSYLLQTKLTEGLFRGAILQSGTTLNLWALARNKKTDILAMADFLGINSTDSNVLMSELQKLDYQKLSLISSIFEVLGMGLTNPLDGLLWSPTIEPEHDGAVVTGKSFEKLTNGDFNRVPIMVGVNSEEAIMFLDYEIPISIYFWINGILPERFVPKGMNVNDNLIQELGMKIYNQYFPEGMSNATDVQIIKFLSEDEFVRPIIKTVQLTSQYTPVYFYYYTFLEDDRKNATVVGASHGDEMTFLWHGQKEKEIPMTKKLVTLWTNFAKELNPTPSVDPIVENVIWPTYSEGNSYLVIGDTLNVTNELFYQRWQFWEDIAEEYGNRPYDTY